ncbi:MAG: response regulator transcription factor [Candidatus Obscuribacterales bacterium]|jgi:two-component system, OmpR family, copper resistance phosphate regulon response regulator CusR|nr:response regulator transcription factor [Candidatus Obscuribacterales bacterium]
MAKILIVEDDIDIREQVAVLLEAENFEVESVANGEEAEHMLAVYGYDLILLDWQLPVCSGIDLLKIIRAKGNLTPVLMLTGKNTIDDKETGFILGADDYLIKPFEPRELLARVKALLRRSSGNICSTLCAGSLLLDPEKHRVTVDGKELRLLPKEFALLEFFLRHPNQVFNSETLLARVWSSDSEASSNTVKSYMYTLRRKLATVNTDSLIETMHGVGYTLRT